MPAAGALPHRRYHPADGDRPGALRAHRAALSVVGRSDDMVVVRGINVFPAQIASVINRNDALSGEYRIRLEGPAPYDLLPVEVECARIGAAPALADSLAASIKRDLGVSARIDLLPFGSLPRSEGKTRRVIRKDR
jgi:Coenzyme F390 synthetase